MHRHVRGGVAQLVRAGAGPRPDIVHRHRLAYRQPHLREVHREVHAGRRRTRREPVDGVGCAVAALAAVVGGAGALAVVSLAEVEVPIRGAALREDGVAARGQRVPEGGVVVNPDLVRAVCPRKPDSEWLMDEKAREGCAQAPCSMSLMPAGAPPFLLNRATATSPPSSSRTQTSDSAVVLIRRPIFPSLSWSIAIAALFSRMAFDASLTFLRSLPAPKEHSLAEDGASDKSLLTTRP